MHHHPGSALHQSCCFRHRRCGRLRGHTGPPSSALHRMRIKLGETVTADLIAKTAVAIVDDHGDLIGEKAKLTRRFFVISRSSSFGRGERREMEEVRQFLRSQFGTDERYRLDEKAMETCSRHELAAVGMRFPESRLCQSKKSIRSRRSNC